MYREGLGPIWFGAACGRPSGAARLSWDEGCSPPIIQVPDFSYLETPFVTALEALGLEW